MIQAVRRVLAALQRARAEKLMPKPETSTASAEVPRAFELSAGDLVGEYRVETKLGEGGFGSVYRVVHPLIGKSAAVKVLNPHCSAQPEVVARFVEEARAVNQIQHRNIIDIFSFGRLQDGRQYFVMELLRGEPLDRYLRKNGRLTLERTIEVLSGVAQALDAAHASGIVHRDLKPENVFLVTDGERELFPKLLDFGVAKLVGQPSEIKTETGVPIGTPYYMSPEQCRGVHVDHRTDVYAFGVLVFELLTGQRPFDGGSRMDIMMMHVMHEVPSLSELCDLPAALDGPVRRMLAKEAKDRPASVGDALRELATAAQAAGFDVDVDALHSALVRAAVHRVSRDSLGDVALSEADRFALGSATTVDGAATPKRSSGLDVTPRRRALTWLGSAGLVALVAAAAAFTWREPAASHGPAVGIASSAVAEATVQTAASFEPRADPLPAAAPALSAAPLVEVTIQSTPRDAEIWQDNTRLGTASAPLALPKSDRELVLTLKAAGYRSQTLRVTPSRSSTQSVVLAKRRAKPRGGSELEF